MKYSRLLSSALILGWGLTIAGYAALSDSPSQKTNQVNSTVSKKTTAHTDATPVKTEKQGSKISSKNDRQVGENTGLMNKVEVDMQTW